MPVCVSRWRRASKIVGCVDPTLRKDREEWGNSQMGNDSDANQSAIPAQAERRMPNEHFGILTGLRSSCILQE